MAGIRNKSLASAYTAFTLLFLVIIIGVIGYKILGFSFIESFYQTVITIATVGFKEVHPLSDTGMIFTAFLIIFSFGIFAYAVTTLTRYIVEGDAVDEEVLVQCRIQHARALITTLPLDADNLFVVLTAKELNPNLKVISRASVDHADVKLKRAGATNVIMPDKIGGQRMAKLVAQANIVEFIDYMLLQSTENVVLEEISCENIASRFAGKPIGQLDLKNESGANIIGLGKEDKSYQINPLPETELTPSDSIFVPGTRKQLLILKNLISSESD
jgi:Trk K+ transport system NAD-binding subunit